VTPLPNAPTVETTPEGVVVVDLVNLLANDPPVDLSASIQAAFGSHDEALGVILVRGIPDYEELRNRLLRQASVFANLPDDIKDRLTVPDAQYSFGWSHGKERTNDRLDTEKGSFYANPLMDDPGANVTPEIRQQYPMYYHGNVWPTQAECPEFEEGFKALGNLICGVGFLLARHCDAYAQANVPGYRPNLISNALQASDTIKARLLHYFPQNTTQTASSDEASWCGWHLDHSFLTGLTNAMYVDETHEFRVTEASDPEAGLYVKRRSGEIVQVRIPEDHIAFQAGEALQVASGNRLLATWHYVRSPRPSTLAPGRLIARNTFAVFMQPSVSEVLDEEGLTFGEFTRQVLSRHY
jgi:isopenicillin N synthase-like dioxygenase